MIWKEKKKRESGFAIPQNCFELLLSFTVEFNVSSVIKKKLYINTNLCCRVVVDNIRG